MNQIHLTFSHIWTPQLGGINSHVWLDSWFIFAPSPKKRRQNEWEHLNHIIKIAFRQDVWANKLKIHVLVKQHTGNIHWRGLSFLDTHPAVPGTAWGIFELLGRRQVDRSCSFVLIEFHFFYCFALSACRAVSWKGMPLVKEVELCSRVQCSVHSCEPWGNFFNPNLNWFNN